MSWIEHLAERLMRLAEAQGQLSGLAGEGKPLPDRPVDPFISGSDAVGYRIMAEAGVLPEEITVKKKAAAQREHLATLTDPEERKAAMAELARLELQQALAEEARRAFLKG